MSNRKSHSWPDNHWHWPVELSHYHGVRRGGFIFTGGQADLDGQGNVGNPDALEQQTVNVLAHVSAILTDLDASLNDLVKLVIYFTGDASDEANILELIAQRLDEATRPVVSTVCLPALCSPGMRIELEAIAIDPSQLGYQKPVYFRNAELPALHAHFSHLVRCNDLIFTGDISAIGNYGEVQAEDDVIDQTHIMMQQLNRALVVVGASVSQVVKINVFYVGDGTADNWEEPAAIRAAYFQNSGPAATGIAVKSFPQAGLMTKMCITLAAAAPGAQLPLVPVRYSWPSDHWNWTTALPYQHGNRFGQIIHLGGQVALDAESNVLHPNNVVEQTHIALENVRVLLADLGATMNDVVKVTTFYQGNASASDLHQNLLIRSAAFKKPGPATSGIPVPHLVYESMVIEIDVIAIARAN